jgi:septum formation protein
MSEAEIDAYVASGEPLECAGSFTIDGLGGAFIERIEGDPHTVVGLSISTLRTLLASAGVSITDLWSHPDAD